MTKLQGTDLLFRRWDAAPSPAATTRPASPRAVFLLVHGLGAHTARWDFLAGYLAANGFVSYALELRGFGRTPERPRGHVDSFEVWNRDILALRETIGRDLPEKKVFLLGESMGGLLAYDVAGRHPGLFAGAVHIAPAFKNGMKFHPSDYIKLALFLPFNPTLMIDLPFTSEMATRDPGYAAVMNENPDELRVASLKLLASFLPVQGRAGRLAKTFSVPSLFLIPGVDHLVDERAGRKVFGKVAAADKTIVEYPEMFHALSIDLGRETVFRDILDWTAKRV
ncbi:MAG: alpha/beta fold hydrolase [Candidatus Aminicenantales bacterium]